MNQLKGQKPKQAFVRFETEPGEQAQVDWSDFGSLEIGDKVIKLWCFSMVLGFSRMLYIEFMPSQNFAHLGQAHIDAFEFFGGVTDMILYDNMKTVVLSREGGQIQWNPTFIDFASHYQFTPKLCQPGRKETKGKVERPFSYIRSSFFDGSTFTDLDDINARARTWLDTVANVRIHATTKVVPRDRLTDENLSKLRTTTYQLGHFETHKSTKDCFISFEGNRYSIPYLYSCRELRIKVNTDALEIYCGDKLIAQHHICYQKGQIISNPKHFLGIPKPAYPSSIRALREMFLAHFPNANPFLDGLVEARYGNARYHLRQIVDLLDDYPTEVIENAIQRATRYGAFSCKAIRNIVEGQKLPQLSPSQVELTHKPAVASETVETRALSDYSAFEA